MNDEGKYGCGTIDFSFCVECENKQIFVASREKINKKNIYIGTLNVLFLFENKILMK